MAAKKVLLNLFLCGFLASFVTSSAIKGRNQNTGSGNNRPFWVKTTLARPELMDQSAGENDGMQSIVEQPTGNADANIGHVDDDTHSFVSLDQNQVKQVTVDEENQPDQITQHFQDNKQQEIVASEEAYPSTDQLPVDETTHANDKFEQQLKLTSEDSAFGVRFQENSNYPSSSCSVKGGCGPLTKEAAPQEIYSNSDVNYSSEEDHHQTQDGQLDFGQRQQFDTLSTEKPALQIHSEQQLQEQIQTSVPEQEHGFSSSFGNDHITNDHPRGGQTDGLNDDISKYEKSEFGKDEQQQTHTGNLDLAAPYDELGVQEYVPPEESYHNIHPTSQTINDDHYMKLDEGRNVPSRSEQAIVDQHRNNGYSSENIPPLFNGQSIIPDEQNLNYQNRHDGQYHYSGNPIDWLREAVPGNPGVDYPIFYTVPETSFHCNQQQFAAGIYGDVDALCQVFHVCKANGGQDSFLCPNGTVFNQQYFVCDWWYNYNCSDTPDFYNLNAQLYWDIDSFTPSNILTGSSGDDGTSFGQVGIPNGVNTAYDGGQYFQPDITNAGQQVIVPQRPDDYGVISDQGGINSETGGNSQQQPFADQQVPQYDGFRYFMQPTMDFQKPIEGTSFSGLEENYDQIQTNEPIGSITAQRRPTGTVTSDGNLLVDTSVPVQTHITDIPKGNEQGIDVHSTDSDTNRGTLLANNDGSRLNENDYVQQHIDDENYFQPNQEFRKKDGESIYTNVPVDGVHQTFQTTIHPTSEEQDTEYTRYEISNQRMDLSPKEDVIQQPVENVIFPDQKGQYPDVGQNAFVNIDSTDRVSDDTRFDGSPDDSSQTVYPTEVQQQIDDISFSRGSENAETDISQNTNEDSPSDSSGSLGSRHQAGESSFQQQEERVFFPSEDSQERGNNAHQSRSEDHRSGSFDNRHLTDDIENIPVQHLPQLPPEDTYVMPTVQQIPEQVAQTDYDEVQKQDIAKANDNFRVSTIKESGGTQNIYEQQEFIDIPDIPQTVKGNLNVLEDFQKRKVAFMETGEVTPTLISPEMYSSTTAPDISLQDHSELTQKNTDEKFHTQLSNQVKNVDGFTRNNGKPQTQNFRIENIHSMVRGPQRIRQTEEQRSRDSIHQRFIFRPNQQQISDVNVNPYEPNIQELIQSKEIQQSVLPQAENKQQIHQQQHNIPSQSNIFIPHVNEDSARDHAINRPEANRIASDQQQTPLVDSINWWNQMPQTTSRPSHSRPSIQQQTNDFEFQQGNIPYDGRAPVQVFQESVDNNGLPKRNFDIPHQVRMQENYGPQNTFGSDNGVSIPQNQEITRQPQIQPYPANEPYGINDQIRKQNSQPVSQDNFHIASGVRNFQENARNIKSSRAFPLQNHGAPYSQVVPSSSEISGSYKGWKPIIRQ